MQICSMSDEKKTAPKKRGPKPKVEKASPFKGLNDMHRRRIKVLFNRTNSWDHAGKNFDAEGKLTLTAEQAQLFARFGKDAEKFQR